MISTQRIAELAEEYGTPLYILDKEQLDIRVNRIKEVLGEKIKLCFAMKANPFFVDAFKRMGVLYEVCSPGEFVICEREGVDLKSVVLSGVNKEQPDVEHAMDTGKVARYTAESVNQLKLLEKCAAEKDIKAPVLLRVTSGNQFGLDESEIERVAAFGHQDYPHLLFCGIQCYTGTQKKKADVFISELTWLDNLCTRLYEKYGFEMKELEYGPGLPVNYFGEAAYHSDEDMLYKLAETLDTLKDRYHITLEMGRYMVSECGIYVTSVADIKKNKGLNYVIVDGGINHVNYYGQTMAMKIPAYSYVRHDGTIVKDYDKESLLTGNPEENWTVCGSLCTVADVLVKNLPIGIPEYGDRLILYNMGAYSVTEGIYLFLSRKMPKIIACNAGENVEVYREFYGTDVLNTRSL